jgi:hypothetical protein
MSFRLCFLGIIGVCPGNVNSSNTLLTKQTQIISDYCSEQVSNVISTSSTSINQSQILSIKSDGNVLISDLNFSQLATLSSKASIEITNNVTDENNISELVNDIADASIEQNLIDSGNPSGNVTRTDLESKVVTEITKKVKSSVSSSSISSCVSSIVNSQEITIVTTGNVEIKVLNLSQTALLMAECIMKTIVSSIKKITLSTDISSQIESTQKRTDTNPITETVSGITNNIMIVIIILIIIIGFPIIIIIVIMVLRKKNNTINPPDIKPIKN